jgi:hypothetical protein
MKTLEQAIEPSQERQLSRLTARIVESFFLMSSAPKD